jgi:putative transposase
MSWKKRLESVSESVNDHLRLRNDYLMAENRILRHQIDGRVQLTDSKRKALAELGAKLGKQALEAIATMARPDTILAWNRTFADQQVDTSEPHQSVGCPRVDKEIEDLVVCMARENRTWGYDRIQGALTHLGYMISDQAVGHILKRHGISPAPERHRTVTWREFVRSHLDMWLATDFFTSESWRGVGLLISSLLCFIHVARHQSHTVGMTLHQHVQQMRSLVLRSLEVSAHRQPWIRVVKKVARSGVTRCGAGVLGKTAAEFVPRDERQPLSHALGKIVFWPSVNVRHIRDGPHPRRQRLDALRADDLREVA